MCVAAQGEADAAKALARDADMREMQDRLMGKQAQIAELTLEVSKVREFAMVSALSLHPKCVQQSSRWLSNAITKLTHI